MAGSSVNKVILVGNLGKDPEIRAMQNGKEMATFNLATSESWVDKKTNDRTEKTEWHTVVVFVEGIVRIVKDYLRKGNKVYLEGALQTRKWTDQNNNDRYTTEVVLQGFSSVLTILDSKSSAPSQPLTAGTAGTTSNVRGSTAEYDDFEMAVDDDIPF